MAAVGIPQGTGLCEGGYRAYQTPGVVSVVAEGIHPTSGYTSWLEQSAIAVFPPEFTLWHVQATGEVLQVLTPFSVHRQFPARTPVERVIVHDAIGRHEVGLEQVLDAAFRTAGENPPYPWVQMQ